MSGYQAIDPQPTNVKEMLRTTFACKCPACGKGRLFSGFYKLHATCEVCDARFERGRGGEWMGPVVISYALGAGIAFFVWLYLFATDRLFTGVEAVIGAIAIGITLATYRNAKAYWIWFIYAAGLVFPDRNHP